MISQHQVDLLPILGDHRLLVEIDMHLLDVMAIVELVKDGL